ncbi:SAV_2336 N-terminal domain-related protein [Actinoplanes lobatus]|uniref:Tetratricopeptide repeat protein n=1 Tax=Actinoplanes lobatus TaxID=113568 RepID=A0ABQ4AIP5_9ACTN|nr:SAV_2336 N-terminal domain-related protein [Actinoplanes lobatus]GIE40872.1 hypothetical protein Alo02nite_37700 [Actinoplanes lobatus]
MSVAGLIETLQRAGLSPTGREVAEALWLARHLHVAPTTPSPAPSRPADAPPTDLAEPSPALSPSAESVPIAVPSPAAGAEPVPAFPVRSPAPPGLPDPRGLQRALRPLRRRVPSPRRRVLDEAATARFIAGSGVWAPILAPAAERRFEAVLAVDTSPSMAVWRQLEADLARLLSRSGAFRDVRLCRLDGSAETLTVRTGRSGVLRPAQLIDGARRRIFLLLTDAVGARWHDGSAAREIAGWARTGPMAVLQPLPEQLWSRTGLPGRAARVTVTGTGVANEAWSVRYRRAAPEAGVAVPVLGLTAGAWRSWIRVVAGRADGVPLAIATLAPAQPSVPAWEDEPSGEPVEGFRASASPAAYQLAVCLSAVPLTLDTMRLVQHAVVGAPPSALAEVLLGGLLIRTGDESFEFIEDARERLLDELRRSEATRIVRVMSSYLAEHAGTAGPSFPALLPDVSGYLQVPAETFAWLPTSVVQRLGLRPRQSILEPEDGSSPGDRATSPHSPHQAQAPASPSFPRPGQTPAEAESPAFLQNLSLEALIEQAGAAHRALLRDLTVFELPVPEPVAALLAERVGGSATRLWGLGLLDVSPDAYDPQQPALAVNALAAGRIDPLNAAEIADLARLVAEPLYASWGGAEKISRDPGLDLQLTRLALHADTPRIVADCATGAMEALWSGPAVDAFRLGQEAIALLDRHQVPLSLLLLRRVAGAAQTSGDGDAAGQLYGRASRQAQTDDPDQIDPLDRAHVSAEHATYLIGRGDLPQAERLLRQAHDLFTSAGSDDEAAACQGIIADIFVLRGDYDEALRIRREVELPVYQRLGDTRSAALTWGSIADILHQRGEYDEALRIRRGMQLPVYERLGDTRSAAITWDNIADILYRRGEYDEALQIRQEKVLPVNERHNDLDGIANTTLGIAQIQLQQQDFSSALPNLLKAFEILERLQRPDGIAVVGVTLGELLAAIGEPDSARKVWEKSLAAATKIGFTDLIERISALLRNIDSEPRPVDG